MNPKAPCRTGCLLLYECRLVPGLLHLWSEMPRGSQQRRTPARCCRKGLEDTVGPQEVLVWNHVMGFSDVVDRSGVVMVEGQYLRNTHWSKLSRQVGVVGVEECACS